MKTSQKRTLYRRIAGFMAINLLAQTFLPTVAWALTSGPSQPEVQSFEPVGTTEMVDLFSGDFTYNIPLLELPGPNGGYPFNLHYNSGITMDQEASWTGLGWNLNPGAINRQMRGLPDEFNGQDEIKSIRDIRPNVTFGVGANADLEVFGADFSEGTSGNPSLSVALSVYYNNYKGVGYSLGADITAMSGKSEAGTTNGGIGLNLSLDSQEGVGADASLSLQQNHSKTSTNYSLGVGYNSLSGLKDISLSAGLSSRQKRLVLNKSNELKSVKIISSIGSSSSLSLSRSGYTPFVSTPMEGRNLSLQFKVGSDLKGVFMNGALNGYYNVSYLSKANRENKIPAYGYLNLHKKPKTGDKETKENVLLDFNREHDGMMHKTSPNVPIPVTTPDIYSVTGQGMAGMYRVFRNDIGILHDQYSESRSVGGSLGVEIGPGPDPEWGCDISINKSKTISGKWTDDNAVIGNADFGDRTPSGLEYESAYFKSYGEHTSNEITQLDFIGGESPARLELTDNGTRNFGTNDQLVPKEGSSIPLLMNQSQSKREKRNVVLQYIDNDSKKGMYALNPDGTTYYYEKVANTNQVECMFSAGPQGAGFNGPIMFVQEVGGKARYKFNNTDKYYSRTETSNYAHAYMLTAIVGPDYVDADGKPGPTKDDLGYWVKFNYNEQYYNNLGVAVAFTDPEKQTGIDNNWRAPFYGANYLESVGTTFTDDKGSYMYGTKKVFYLTSAETKTHRAEFQISRRDDARGALKELQNDNGLGAYSYKLDKIKLFSNNNKSKAIKTVNFEYTYELCKGNPNHTSNATGGIYESGESRVDETLGGKLTLKRVYFTYENSKRGQLSPYEFGYTYSNATTIPPNENPSYNTHKNDRWGFYQPNTDEASRENPYVTQCDEASNTSDRETANMQKAVWHMKSIKLPTGGTIKIQYESDDYAYVQDKKAMQMFKIASLVSGNTTQNVIDHDRGADDSHRKLYFSLEKNILDDNNKQTEIDRYCKGIDQLFFRVNMWVRKRTDDNIKDYVEGYVDVEDYGLDEGSVVDNGTERHYTRGYITMKYPKRGTRKGKFHEIKFHPFSVAAWQYIRTDNPTLMGMGPFDADPDASKSAKLAKVKSLVSIIPEVARIFTSFNEYAHGQDWGEVLDLNKSYIRLNSPDQIKIGGGVRVKKIVLEDNWASVSGEENSQYGQVYDYTLQEDGRTISSGVAQNEPQVGSEESPMRRAKEYPEAISLKTNNMLYFEEPINESYYPGASVGYRKVTVKSLATHYSKINGADDPHNIPDGILTSGAVVHDFYTAREFPVIADETEIRSEPKNLWIPLPFIGQISINHLTASQGYSIILNDMHGKPRKVSTFKAKSSNGQYDFTSPVSYVNYKYSYVGLKDENSDGEYESFKLKNDVPVLEGDFNGVTSRSIKALGEDFEFFTDMRSSLTEAGNAGLKLNVDVLITPLPIPIPPVWPAFSYNESRVRTSATNKIIHRSGILLETEVFDGAATVSTRNELFDGQTGQAVLTSVNNDFGDPIYNYNYPAFYAYDGLGAAYQNIGLSFTATSFTDVANSTLKEVVLPLTVYNLMCAGDEFIMGSPPAPANKAVVVKKESGKLYVKVTGTTNTTCVITRSGRRNQLQVMAGNIKTLGDKTKKDIRKAVETGLATDKAIGDPTDNFNRE